MNARNAPVWLFNMFSGRRTSFCVIPNNAFICIESMNGLNRDQLSHLYKISQDYGRWQTCLLLRRLASGRIISNTITFDTCSLNAHIWHVHTFGHIHLYPTRTVGGEHLPGTVPCRSHTQYPNIPIYLHIYICRYM